MIGSNWENFLKNLGEWRGSFTKISLDGEVLDSTPSILTLEQAEPQLVRFRLQRFGAAGYSGAPVSDFSQEYRSLGRQIIFFDTGAFSKGSLQLAPYGEFGAEYGFVGEHRRMRFVQLYDSENKLSSLTLIREFRNGTDAPERPPLTVEQLLGIWEGTAWSAFPDWTPPQTFATRLEIEQTSSDRLQHRLMFGDRTITSTARIEGNRLWFDEGATPRQILLLPDGASSNTPLQISHRQPCLVEVGWLVGPNERQRLIRSYNEKGEWISATHVIEHRVG